jgi:triosephosphate isomerase
MHWAPEGAYTGEVSAPMLHALGCRYVILGHSERRTHFGESDEFVRKKLEAALSGGLRPIFCLGEELATREAGRAEAFCLRQLRAGLAGLRVEDPSDLVVAYEPVWAIGTGKTATPADAAAVIRVLREETGRIFGKTWADLVRFLYGGSMTPEYIVPFMEEEEIDGVLVGGASLKVDSFAEIIRGTARVRGQAV